MNSITVIPWGNSKSDVTHAVFHKLWKFVHGISIASPALVRDKDQITVEHRASLVLRVVACTNDGKTMQNAEEEGEE